MGLLSRKVDPERLVFGAEVRGIQERVAHAKPHDVVAAGERDRLADRHAGPEYLLARLCHVAAHIDRTVVGDLNRDLVRIDDDHVFPTIARPLPKSPLRQFPADLGLEGVEREPRGMDRRDQGEMHHPVDIDHGFGP